MQDVGLLQAHQAPDQADTDEAGPEAGPGRAVVGRGGHDPT